MRVAGFQRPLCRLERARLDDGRRVGVNVLLVGLGLAGPAVQPVEAPMAAIDGICQKLMHGTEAPHAAAPRPVAPLVQPGSDAFHPEGSLPFVAAMEQTEDEADLFGFNLIDNKALLDACAPFLDLHRAIAEGRLRSVPEPLPGILLHGAQDVLGVFFRLVLVEEGDDLPHHDLRRIIAKLLRNGDEADAVLGEPADVELEAEGIAEEAREGMYDDHIEGPLPVARALNHSLKLGPLVVGCGCAGLDVFGNDLKAACFSPGQRLRALIGD